MPIPRTISDHYGVPPESYWHSASFEVAEDYFSRQISGAIQIIGEDKTIKAIDVGLGLGKAARAMIAAGFDVYGLEPSEPFYRRALEQLNSQCTDRFQLASMEAAEFPVGEFDFVTFGAVLEHIYDPSQSIAKAIRWLKTGGIVHIEVPNSNHLMSKFINAYYRMLGTVYVTNISPMHKPYHLYEFTLASFQKNGQVGGYEVAHHWFDVASIYHVPRVLHPPLRLWMKYSNSGMQLTVFLRKTS